MARLPTAAIVWGQAVATAHTNGILPFQGPLSAQRGLWAYLPNLRSPKDWVRKAVLSYTLLSPAAYLLSEISGTEIPQGKMPFHPLSQLSWNWEATAPICGTAWTRTLCSVAFRWGPLAGSGQGFGRVLAPPWPT